VKKAPELQELRRDLKLLKTNLAFTQRRLTCMKAAAVHLAHGVQALAKPQGNETRNLK
jgi:hypothetical protein